MTRYIPLFCYISVNNNNNNRISIPPLVVTSEAVIYYYSFIIIFNALECGLQTKNTIKSAGMTKGRLTTPDRALMQE